MHKPIKYVEKGLTYAAKGAWVAFDALNSIKPGNTFIPKWSDIPLQKSWQKVKPPLGWPRETDSLCPVCVREARHEIVDGKRDYKILLNEKIGEIKAQIIERDGKILMVKDCPVHGHFEDVCLYFAYVLFDERLERLLAGEDPRACFPHAGRTQRVGRPRPAKLRRRPLVALEQWGAGPFRLKRCRLDPPVNGLERRPQKSGSARQKKFERLP